MKHCPVGATYPTVLRMNRWRKRQKPTGLRIDFWPVRVNDTGTLAGARIQIDMAVEPTREFGDSPAQYCRWTYLNDESDAVLDRKAGEQDEGRLYIDQIFGGTKEFKRV
jgi:hypothetical protein